MQKKNLEITNLKIMLVSKKVCIGDRLSIEKLQMLNFLKKNDDFSFMEQIDYE